MAPRVLCHAASVALLLMVTCVSPAAAVTVGRVRQAGSLIEALAADGRGRSGARGAGVPLDLPLPVGYASFTLRSHAAPTGADFRARIVGPGGERPDATSVVLFADDRPGGDFVRLAMVGGQELHGVVRYAGVLYSITTGRRLGRKNRGEPMLSIDRMSERELRAAVGKCPVTSSVPITTVGRGQARASVRRVVRLALEADHAFTLRYGPGVAGVMLAMVDAVNALYEPLDVQFEVGFLRAWEVPDPYLDNVNKDALFELRGYWEGTEIPAHGGAFTNTDPGLIQLLQGTRSTTSTIGLAFTSGNTVAAPVCTSTRYSVVDVPGAPLAILAVVSAHELGHNFGLPHAPEPGTIMYFAASLTTTWAPSSIADFSARLAGSFGLEGSVFDDCLAPLGQTSRSLAGRVITPGACAEGVAGVTIDGGALGTRVTSPDGSFSFGTIAGDLPFALTPLPLQPGDGFAPPVSSVLPQAGLTFVMTRTGCGDQAVDAGEECDVGTDSCGTCCDGLCRFRPALTVCREGVGACDAAERCSGSAAECPSDGASPDGTSCNTADPCNPGATCSSGVCSAPTVPDLEACLDYLLCYRAKSPDSDVRLLWLNDAFDGDDSSAVLQRAKGATRLCVPRAAGGASFVGYKTKRMEVPFSAVTGVDTRDAFGTLTLDVRSPLMTLAPAAQGAAPPWGARDQYACYKVKPSLGTPRMIPRPVTVRDANGVDVQMTLRRPATLCVPVEDPGTLRSQTGALLCYQVKRPPEAATPIPVVGVFPLVSYLGPAEFSTVKEGEVCVPATVE